jgi:hypothetical protein
MVLFVLSIVAASAVEYATHGSQAAAVDAARAKSFSLAESGINYAAAILNNPVNDPTNSSILPSSSSPASVTLDGGTTSYWGSYNSSSMIWTVTGKGTVRNPSATNALSHTITEQFQVNSSTNNGAWNYLYTQPPAGSCFSLANSVKINEPLFVRGDLCMDNSSQVTSGAGNVYVSGTITIASGASASVGTSASPVPNLHVGGGCRIGTGSFNTPCTSAQHVYATNQDTNVPATPTKPSVNLNYWYTNAQPGPMHNCTTGSFPGGFDTGDGVMNTSLPSAVDLMPSSAYNCTVTSGGQTIGQIAWSPGNPGTLTIKGTIFFDGNISMTGSARGLLSGSGTIYASGTINMAGSTQICGVFNAGSCDWSNWNPNTNMLVMVAGSTGTTPDLTLGQSAQYQGGLYASTDFSQGSSVKVQGPVVANNMYISASSQASWPNIGTFPQGTPGGSSVSVIPGTWKG